MILLLAVHHDLELVVVDLPAPVADHDAGDAVADHVGEGAGLGHEAVDAENECKTGDRHMADGGERGGKHDEARTRHAGGALRGEEQHGKQRELLGERHGDVAGLGDEDRGHRQVDGGAVKIEGVARRNDETHDGAGHAGELHLRHHARQHGLGRGRAEHDQEFLLDVGDVAHDREAVDAADGAEHAEDEEKAGQVERAHQLRQRQQRGDAVLADREGHGAEGADGSHAHDHADDLEENVCGLLDHVEDQRAAAAELVQREAEEDGEEEHLQDVAVGKGAHDGVRDDVHQEFRRRLHLAGTRIGGNRSLIERVRIDMHADAGLDRVDDDETDDECDGRDDLKVEKRKTAGLADLLHVLHARNACHDRAENHGRDDHFDEADEAVAEGLHLSTDLGCKKAQENADDNGADDLKVQHLVNRSFMVCRSRGHL